MKRKAFLIGAATVGAVVLALTQLSNAANPAKDSTPAASSANNAAVTPGGPGGHDPKGDRLHGPRGFRDGGKFGQGEERRGPGMFGADLNLTPEQKAKVKEVMEAARPKIEAIRAEERAKIKAVLDEAQAQIRPTLSPEQQQVMDDANKLRESMQKLRRDAAALKKND